MTDSLHFLIDRVLIVTDLDGAFGPLVKASVLKELANASTTSFYLELESSILQLDVPITLELLRKRVPRLASRVYAPADQQPRSPVGHDQSRRVMYAQEFNASSGRTAPLFTLTGTELDSVLTTCLQWYRQVTTGVYEPFVSTCFMCRREIAMDMPSYLEHMQACPERTNTKLVMERYGDLAATVVNDNMFARADMEEDGDEAE